MLGRGAFFEEFFVEIERRDRRHRVQTRIKTRHRRRDDGCSDNAQQPRETDRRDEVEYDQVFVVERLAAVVTIEEYAEAEQALGAFIDRYPDDPLAGNAQYWLGETYYVRGDYQQAAVTFAEAYKNYPNGAKAPDNLLKLGLSLASLGNSADACGTFAELMRRYPESSPGIVRRARTESQKLNCS